jgi:gliding motility-associated-like protein
VLTLTYRIFLLQLALAFCNCLHGQAIPYTWEWAEEAYTINSEFAQDVAVDPINGDVVVVGEFTGDISAFYGSPFVGAQGGGFVARYTSSGTLLWAFKIGENDNDRCKGVAIDGTGNIYVTGYLTINCDFKGNSPSSTILTSVGGRDAFLAKYDQAGLLQWVKNGGGSSNDEGLAVAVSGNRVYLTGYYHNAATFGALNTNSGINQDNLILVTYDATTGSELWLADAGCNSDGYGYDVVADVNSVYITGTYRGSLTLYDATGSLVANPPFASSEEGFIAAFSSTGTYSWLSLISGSFSESANSLTLVSGDIFITGSIDNAATFTGYAGNPVVPSGTDDDFYVAQLSGTTGVTQWVACEPGGGDQTGTQITNDGINIVVCGHLSGSMTFTGGPTVTSTGNDDLFVARYRTDGAFDWVQTATGIDNQHPNGIACTNTEHVYVCGEYRNTSTFGAYTLPGIISSNIFVARMSCPPVTNNIISSAQSICEGSTPATLTGSSPTGGSPPYIFLWEQSPDNISWSTAIGTNNLQNYSPPALFTNTYYRRTVSSTGGCLYGSVSSSILITVDSLPTTSNAGPDQTVCSSSATLAGNTALIGSGMWSLVSGTGTVTTPSSETSGITAMNPGANSFQWVITNGTCPSSADTVIINVDAMPTTANAGSDQTLCSSSATFAGNTPLSGTGMWTLISGTGTITTPSLESSTVTSLSVGANSFQWLISNGTCPSSMDTVIINVDAMPTVANAGAEQTLCSSSSTFSGNTPIVGSGMWTLISGSGTPTTPSSEISGVTGLAVGANAFEWSITNGTCPSSLDTVVINVDTMPTVANAGPDQTLCSSSATFAGNTPLSGSGMWTLISGTGNIATPNLESSTVTSLSVGANSFQWLISNGTCPSSMDTVIINVDAMPTVANAGPDQTICSSSSAFTANSPVVGTGMWTLISGSGTPTTPSSETSGVTGLAVGADIFEWSIRNGACPSSLDTVVINVDAMPTAANAGPDQTLCASSATLSGNTPLTGMGTWTLLSGSGTVVTPTSEVSGVTGMNPGANIFEWLISNETCPSSADTVIINVDAMPTVASAGPDQNLCASVTTLAGNTALSGNAMWALLSGSGTLTTPTSETSGITAMAPGANIFVWTISNGTCPSSTDTVTINVDAMPTVANAGPDQTLCSSTSTHAGNIALIGNGMWTLLSGSGSITTPASETSGITAMNPGANIFEWLISNGTCPSSADTVIITVDAMPTVASAGPDQTLCSSSAIFAGNTPITGNGIWTLVTGTGTVATPTFATSAVNGLSIGANTFSWTINNGTCPTSVDLVTINVDAMPTVANAGPDQTICTSWSTMTGNMANVGIATWTLLSGSGVVTTPMSETSAVTGMSPGANIFQWFIGNGTCPASTDTVIINVENPPTFADAGPDQTVDHPFFSLQGNIPLFGTGAWEIVSGSVSLSDPTDPHCTASDMLPGVYVFRWVIRGIVCDSTADEVTITVSEFIIPNGFSPNQDGLNDYFEIPGVGYWENFNVSIYNRWGQLVYQNTNYQNEWNGQGQNGEPLVDDTYYYTVEIPNVNNYSGFVVIKRE